MSNNILLSAIPFFGGVVTEVPLGTRYLYDVFGDGRIVSIGGVDSVLAMFASGGVRNSNTEGHVTRNHLLQYLNPPRFPPFPGETSDPGLFS